MFEHIEALMALVREAGDEILRLYQNGEIEVACKADASPVTAADLASHAILLAGLKRIAPEIPVISEEGELPPFAERQSWPYHWLVDPLDGTKEFIERTDEFTINIALVHEQTPVLGIVYGPVQKRCYWAQRGGKALLQAGQGVPQPLKVRPQTQPMRIAVSRRHDLDKLAAYLEPIGPYELVYQGSAFKLTTVAEGKADLYPRFGQTYGWDTAAGHCILEAAGGQVVDFSGQPLRYNCSESLLNPEFLAVADVNFGWPSYFPA